MVHCDRRLTWVKGMEDTAKSEVTRILLAIERGDAQAAQSLHGENSRSGTALVLANRNQRSGEAARPQPLPAVRIGAGLRFRLVLRRWAAAVLVAKENDQG